MVLRKHPLHGQRSEHWLPTDHAKTQAWVHGVIERSVSLNEKPLDPVLQRFKNFIDSDPIIKRIATDMFSEVPLTPPYNRDPTRFKSQIRSYDQMFECLNVILHEGPQWYKSDDAGVMGLIGFPITAILEWPMGTRNGHLFFTHPSVNAHWKAILNEWAKFLSSPESLHTLDNVNGWLSPSAIEILTANGNNGIDHYTFSQLYQCNPSLPNHGFKSWDDFFTRKFHANVRPIAHPDHPFPSSSTETPTDPTTIILHACESAPFLRKENIQLHSTFWLKNQPYSLADIFHSTSAATPFIGGQIYQAYLSALTYHRWHAPVSGTVTSITHIPGTYYSENFYEEGFAHIIDGAPSPNPLAPNNSQPYLAEVATRAIITIEADNPKIGLMAVVFIGMCEVSSCEFYVRPGERIVKGQLIGSFHFGGSSHCLIFRPETRLRFEDPGPYEGVGYNKKMNSVLARVV